MRKKLLSILLGGAVVIIAAASSFLPQPPLKQFFSDTQQSYPSYEDRSALAAEFGIFGYEGTKEQNSLLADRLRDYYTVPTANGEELVGYSVVSRYKTTLASSMTSSQTTVPTASVTTFDGHTLTMSDLGSKVFLVLEPGTSREEIVVCTAISSTSWTSCTRGLAFYGTTETEVSANKKAHNAGSVVVMSNTHYVYEQITDTDTAQTINAPWTFASTTDFTYLPTTTTTAPTSNSQIATKKYVDDVAVAGAPDATDVTKGLVEVGTDSETVAGTDTGGTGAQLVIKPSQYITNKAYHWNNAVAFGETITAGQILTVSSTDGRYYKADADVLADAQAVLVMAYENGAAGEYKKVLFPGSVIYSLTSLTTSSPYYLSNTAGGVSTSTGTNTRHVGYAMSASTFMFYPIPVQATATPTANAIVQANSSGKIADGWLNTHYGGDGSDGALSVTSGTTTLNAASANIVEKNYTSINIAAGAVLTISNPATSGTVLWLKTTGNCTIDGTINMDSMGATGGAAKTAEGNTANVDMAGNTGTEGYLANIDFSDSTHSGNGGGQWVGANVGAAGGSGAGGFNSTASDSGAAGSASGATGGSGIFFTQTSSTIQMRKHLIMFVGSGGGGGAADATSGSGTSGTITSGAGGRGGGAVVIECAGELVFTGTITADGANGTSASNSCTANQCAAGGGGGGGGGTVLVGANTITTNTGTITVTGGSAGNGADYGGGASGAGTAGKNGHSLVYTNKVFY